MCQTTLVGPIEMPMVFHGKANVHWCETCDVPVIERGSCPSCGGVTTKVPCTPPGDVRPAFKYDIEEIRALADEQWGPGAGNALLPEDGPFLLNPCPAPDRLDEVIAGGDVICSVMFSNLELRSKLILRKGGGQRLADAVPLGDRGRVKADDSAVPFLLDGKNLLSPGIVDADPGIEPGQEVLVTDESGNLVGSGTARKQGEELPGTRGLGVKMRWSSSPNDDERELDMEGRGSAAIPGWRESWDKVVEVNRPLLERKVNVSVRFIRRTIKNIDLPPAVSFSGGKDSLATLLLVMDAGIEPPLLFADTGIEFPETVEYVHGIAEEFDLALLEGKPSRSFFDDVVRFGPPGRDHRWCCKTLKLGPMVELITENFPNGVLTFIGQRRYESSQREKKGPVWKNPWVPGQTGASPVQDWTALDIWLYIMSKGKGSNPLYEQGFERIGCWPCPASDLAELAPISRTRADLNRWEEALEEESKRQGLPPEWKKYGFHRFRAQPPHMKRLAKDLGIDVTELSQRTRRESSNGMIELVEGHGFCLDGLSREGMISENVPFDVLQEMLNIMGEVERDDDTGGLRVWPPDWKMKRSCLEIYPDGTLMVRGKTEEGLKRNADTFIRLVMRSAGCVGCSICTGRCGRGALRVDSGRRVRLDPDLCIHCGECLGPCPAESFLEDPFDR